MPKLFYFDIYGAAESIRMALWHAKHPYEDVRLDQAKFAELKASGFLPSGQVPAWETDDGKVFNQSNAILHFIGAQTGLYDGTPGEKYWADWSIETVGDLWKGDFYMNFFADSLTEEKIHDVAGKVNTFLGHIEKRLASNGGHHFLAGDKLSIGDIRVFALLHSIAFNDGLKTPALGEHLRAKVHEHAHVKAWNERLTAHFADYLAARPSPRPM